MAEKCLKSRHGVAKQAGSLERAQVVLAVGTPERAVEMQMLGAKVLKLMEFSDNFAAKFGVFETAFAFRAHFPPF